MRFVLMFVLVAYALLIADVGYAEPPGCFARCADLCAQRSGNMSVDACTTQCTVGCSRDNGKITTPSAPGLRFFAAIAIAPSTLEHVAVKGFIKRSDAERAALQACAKSKNKPEDCIIALWFRGTCGSLAIKDDPERKDLGWGAGQAQTSQAAEAMATAKCNKHVKEKSCAVVTTMCAN